MIADATQQNAALAALNAALVCLRQLAYDGAEHRTLAEFLDLLEYLPRLLADRQDRTGEFRDVLLDLAGRHDGFQLALDRYDDRPTSW